jgi:cell volume regulation protein A
MIAVEQILIGIAAILLLSVFASKAAEKYGIPALLLFLFLGMLAGSEGPGGVYFDDPSLAQALGVAALAFILFAGGMDTNWSDVQPVSGRGLLLATVGVAMTAAVVGGSAFFLFGFSLLEGRSWGQSYHRRTRLLCSPFSARATSACPTASRIFGIGIRQQ